MVGLARKISEEKLLFTICWNINIPRGLLIIAADCYKNYH